MSTWPPWTSVVKSRGSHMARAGGRTAVRLYGNHYVDGLELLAQETELPTFFPEMLSTQQSG